MICARCHRQIKHPVDVAGILPAIALQLEVFRPRLVAAPSKPWPSPAAAPRPAPVPRLIKPEPAPGPRAYRVPAPKPTGPADGSAPAVRRFVDLAEQYARARAGDGLGKLEIPSDQVALHARLDAMDERELRAEQLSHHGAIRALEFVMAAGCNPQLVEPLLASLSVNMQCASVIAERKGMPRLIDDHVTGYH